MSEISPGRFVGRKIPGLGLKGVVVVVFATVIPGKLTSTRWLRVSRFVLEHMKDHPGHRPLGRWPNPLTSSQ